MILTFSTLKKYLFKIGFQGTVGKVWNAILSLPEVSTPTYLSKFYY